MFLPTINGKEGKAMKVKRYHYPQEYKMYENTKAIKYDFGVLVLEESLSEIHGYLGIDFRKENLNGVEKVRICGYSHLKETKKFIIFLNPRIVSIKHY